MANKKTSVGKRWAVILIGFLLEVVIALGAAWGTGFALTGNANPLEWQFGSSEEPRTVAIANDGTQLKEGRSYAMPEGFTFLSQRSYTPETPMYVADGEIILTANLSNAFINGEFEWTCSFADASSEWAQGKTAGDYVGLEAVTDGSGGVKVSYLQKFSEQIIITATLKDTDSSATCTVDCLKDWTAYTNDLQLDFGDAIGLETEISFGEGTVEGEFSIDRVVLSLEEQFVEKFQSYLKFDVITTSYIEENIVAGMGDYLCTDIYDGKPAEQSMFIEDFDSYDAAHKQAIFYAWYQAYKAHKNNLLIDYVNINYSYQGVLVNSYTEDEKYGSHITGENDGYGKAPNVELNQNIVF